MLQQSNNNSSGDPFEPNEDDDVRPNELSGDENFEDDGITIGKRMPGKANFLLSVTTIMKTVIGGGILSIPYTFSNMGYMMGMIIFAIVIVLTQYSTVLLLKAKNLSRRSNYSTIMDRIFHNKISRIVCCASIFFGTTGVSIIQFKVLVSCIRKLMEDYITNQDVLSAWYTNLLFIAFVIGFMELPFVLAKKIEKLKYMALTGIVGICVFVLALIIVFFSKMKGSANWSCHPGMVAFSTDITKMAAVIPNMFVALAFQSSMFPIFKGMTKSSDKKMKRVSLAAIIACVFLYAIVGNLGYCLYGNQVQGNFLLVFKRGQINEALYIFINGGFLVSFFFSLPMIFFVARNSFIAMIKIARDQDKPLTSKNKRGPILSSTSVHSNTSSLITSRNQESSEDQSIQPIRKKSDKSFYIYALMLYAAVFIIAITIESIQAVFNVVGAIAANSVTFLCPSLFYFMMVRRLDKPKTWYYYSGVGIFCFFIPFGIFMIISNYL